MISILTKGFGVVVPPSTREVLCSILINVAPYTLLFPPILEKMILILLYLAQENRPLVGNNP